jgi:predicted nucleic acid-binding protein
VRSFIDTNVLVYADDGDDPARQAVAVRLIEAQLRLGTGVVSTQVLQEFVNAGLRKLGLPVDLIRARLALYRRFDVVPASPELIAAALDLHVLHQISFWDAMVVQAARQSGCAQLYTEDMQAGARLAGVMLVNPFA